MRPGRLEYGLALDRAGRGGLGEFKIVLRFHFAKRSLQRRRCRNRHVVSQLKHLAVRLGRANLVFRCRVIQA